MPKPSAPPAKATLEELTKQLADLRHDMGTCGFNSYGVKRGTYYSWLRRVESIHNDLVSIQEKPAPAPPPVPVS